MITRTKMVRVLNKITPFWYVDKLYNFYYCLHSNEK